MTSRMVELRCCEAKNSLTVSLLLAKNRHLTLAYVNYPVTRNALYRQQMFPPVYQNASACATEPGIVPVQSQ